MRWCFTPLIFRLFVFCFYCIYTCWSYFFFFFLKKLNTSAFLTCTMIFILFHWAGCPSLILWMRHFTFKWHVEVPNDSFCPLRIPPVFVKTIPIVAIGGVFIVRPRRYQITSNGLHPKRLSRSPFSLFPPPSFVPSLSLCLSLPVCVCPFSVLIPSPLTFNHWLLHPLGMFATGTLGWTEPGYASNGFYPNKIDKKKKRKRGKTHAHIGCNHLNKSARAFWVWFRPYVKLSWEEQTWFLSAVISTFPFPTHTQKESAV